MRNDGSPRLAMLAMLGGSLSNVVLDYVFIFPCQMGIFGAVFATGLAPCISLAILSLHRRRAGFALRRRAFRLPVVGAVLSLGLPSLVTEFSSGLYVYLFILGLCGNTGVAAYGVIANLSLVVIAIFTGVAQGTQPLLSRAYGTGAHCRGRPLPALRRAHGARAGRRHLCVLILFCTPLVGAFNGAGDAALQAIAEGGLRPLYFLGIPFAGCNIVLSFFFTSTDRALPAHCISLLRGLVLIVPAAFLLSALFGLTGVWLAFPAAEAAVTLCGVLLLRRARADTAPTAN